MTDSVSANGTTTSRSTVLSKPRADGRDLGLMTAIGELIRERFAVSAARKMGGAVS